MSPSSLLIVILPADASEIEPTANVKAASAETDAPMEVVGSLSSIIDISWGVVTSVSLGVGVEEEAACCFGAVAWALSGACAEDGVGGELDVRLPPVVAVVSSPGRVPTSSTEGDEGPG